MLGSVVLAPPASLADLVEAIWDVDVPDPAIARAMAVKVLPTASAIMVVHHRAPISSDRRHYEGCAYKSVVTGVQRETVTLRPSGPTGAVVVRFRPGAAARVFGRDMDAFADANVELDDLVGPESRSGLEAELADAKDQAGRLAAIEAFLRPRVCCDDDPLVGEALRRLRANPALQVAHLARVLDISERQLARRFRATVGAPPKQVVRVLRGERLIAARYRGAAWADIAAQCGFNDQAHMINDFKALAGETPEAFARVAFEGPRRTLNASLVMSGFYNTILV